MDSEKLFYWPKSINFNQSLGEIIWSNKNLLLPFIIIITRVTTHIK